ncbi:MAG: hypothetical protein HPZ91_10280 [Lentisphaeria bacterium]|nr:hypothetical protein [Lentisphaeria bacterium]
MENSKITSFDAEETGVFGDVLNERREADTITVGLLELGYFEYWRMYPALEGIVRRDLEQAAERLRQAMPFAEVVPSGMVDTLDAAERAGELFARKRVRVVVIVAGTYLPDFITLHVLGRTGTDPAVILFNSQTGSRLNPADNYMATMRNSALIAITQLSGSLRKMKLGYDTVVGEISDPAAYAEIAVPVKANMAVRSLRSRTYGLIGHVFRGMYDLEFDRTKIKGFLGPEVMTIQAEHLLECFAQVQESEAEAEAEKLLARFECKDVTRDDVKRSCKVGLAMKALYAKYHLDALCFLGQHYIEKATGAPARMGASLMLEHDRVMVACEGDIGGLTMMDLMHQLTGNIPFQAEWGQFDTANNALFLLGHGIGVPALAKDDRAVRLTASPEEWGFKGSGLNYELIMKPGRVTLGHFLNCGDSYRMLISSGEAVDYPALPCDELHAVIRVEPEVRSYLAKLIDTGCAHHIIAVHGDCAGGLRKCAELMRIESITI